MGDSFPCDVQAERVIKELLNKLNVSVELKNEQRIIPYDVNNVITNCNYCIFSLNFTSKLCHLIVTVCKALLPERVARIGFR